jgi:Permuted papain-like amidase enzyme, YaeF/YiiX, C92 family
MRNLIKDNAKFLITIIIVLIISLILSVLFFNGCNKKSKITKREHCKINFLKIDSATKILQNGDIIFRNGADAISNLFANVNKKDKRYSHCGIYVQQDNASFVLHSVGGESNPNAAIKKESFIAFVNPASNNSFGIIRFNFDKKTMNIITNIAQKWYSEKRTFDMDFDLKTDKKLYCTEYIYKAIQLGIADSLIFSNTIINDVPYVAPDDILLNKNARILWQTIFEACE